MRTRVTRLAPSPTGALHLGNARTFVAGWLLARQRGWKIVLRIEDLDGPRIKTDAAQMAIDDLQWLGIDWDSGPTVQSTRSTVYRAAIDRLIAGGHVYPCICTRREIEAASSAPHAEDGASVYAGTCRTRFASVAEAIATTGRPPALRFAMPDMRFEFRDEFAGIRSFDLQRDLGDFVVAKPDGTAAYQLAVVVDDADAGVTDVVRGDDLIDSVPRQVLLYQALGLEHKIPLYYHLPLVVGSDGRRLAKRHGDTRISAFRDAGLAAPRVLAWIGRSLGTEVPQEPTLADLLARFDLARVPHGRIVYDESRPLK